MVLAEVCAQQRQLGGGEPGLHDRLLVGEVEDDQPAGAAGHRRVRVGGDRGRRDRAAEPVQDGEDLGRRPGPGERQHPVVAAAARHLRGGERVGLPVPGVLAQRRVRLRHEQGGAASDDRHPLPAGRQRVPQSVGEPGGPPPALRLRGDLGHDAVPGHEPLPEFDMV
jgi:hypothetical protein